MLDSGAASAWGSTIAVVNDVIDDLHGSVGLGESDFFCECGDPQCRKRITLTRSEYAGVRDAAQPVFALAHSHRGRGAFPPLHLVGDAVPSRRGIPPSRLIRIRGRSVI